VTQGLAEYAHLEKIVFVTFDAEATGIYQALLPVF
jgi:hypothetical protein